MGPVLSAARAGPDSVSLSFHCRFYDEIRTPLLSDIRVDYPPAVVEQTTRTLFPNYFNGSEIVIAGKLADRKVGQLHVEVTASNSKKFVILKTDVPVEPQRAGHGETGSARPQAGAEPRNHVERLWSYLTVKELLSSWRHSRDEQDRERLRQKAQALALAYRFLTPLTAMHLRSAGQPEKLEEAQGVSAAEGPETVMQSLRGASPQPGEQVRGAPALPPPPRLSLTAGDRVAPWRQRVCYAVGFMQLQRLDL